MGRRFGRWLGLFAALVWLYLLAMTFRPQLATPLELLALRDFPASGLSSIAQDELASRRGEETQTHALTAIAGRSWLPTHVRLRALRELRGVRHADCAALRSIALRLDPTDPRQYPLCEQALLDLCFSPDVDPGLLADPELLSLAARFACTLPPQWTELLAEADAAQMRSLLEQAATTPERWLGFKLGPQWLDYLHSEEKLRQGQERLWASLLVQRLSNTEPEARVTAAGRAV